MADRGDPVDSEDVVAQALPAAGAIVTHGGQVHLSSNSAIRQRLPLGCPPPGLCIKRMLLCSSSGAEISEDVVYLAGDVAFQASIDVARAESLGGPSFDVGPGPWVASAASQGDDMDGAISLSVTTSIESMAVGLA